MNKKDIVREVSKRTDYVQDSVSYVIDTFIDVLKDSVTNGKKININGFLTIETINFENTRRYSLKEKRVIDVPATKKIKAVISPTWELE